MEFCISRIYCCAALSAYVTNGAGETLHFEVGGGEGSATFPFHVMHNKIIFLILQAVHSLCCQRCAARFHFGLSEAVCPCLKGQTGCVKSYCTGLFAFVLLSLHQKCHSVNMSGFAETPYRTQLSCAAP